MRTNLLVALLLPSLAIFACNGETLVVAENSSDGGSSNPPDSNEHFGPSDAKTDGGACCPRDSSPAGCMNLGGSSKNGCSTTCDFFCSTNWRVETDETGCEVWRWDVRAPQAGETQYCFSEGDAGSAGCSPACSGNQVCAKYQILGGAVVEVDDAGTCPAGSHPNGTLCERDPAYECVAKPGACGPGQLDCGCAETICTSKSSCPFTCASTTSTQINCDCQTP